MTNPPIKIPENEATASSSRRPSTSWLRRLSIVSFQTDSSAANSPVTPSFHGSESPIFPGPPNQQRKPPNKLIKRPLSQRSNVNPLFANPPGSPAALRRPATSYQRSETMRLQSPLATDFESRDSECSEPLAAVNEFQIRDQPDWKPYLFSRKSKAQSRHVLSDPSTAPALVSAPMIMTPAASTPNTAVPDPVAPQAVTFRDPFQGSKDQITPLPVPTAKPSHKHSYSLNDVEPKRIVVNTVTASGTPLLGRPRGGSLKRVKGRTFSIPQSELSKPEPTPINPPYSPPRNLQRPRRNITDPSIFRQPHPISPPTLSLAGFARGSQTGPRSVSQDYSIGLQRNRPLTSDAVALSTWQHACRSEGLPYSSLRRRPKRHSIAASDPSSTVLGSDDTRVFTSSDEYETDIMTDYWDSIRTRDVGGDIKGLRIETMFDQAGARLSNEEVTTLEDLLPHGSFASRLERDPPLFSGSLLPPVPVHIDDATSLFEDEPETHSMIGDLPTEPKEPLQSMSNEADDDYPDFPPDLLSEESTGQKMNIFDWSEQSRPDRDQSDSETRPRTVHGKQNGVDRGSRAACRKVPSAVHLRSQSVPVARDTSASDSRQSSGKFGTWGLGSKGVSEDWDSDFDFEDDGDDATTSQETKTAEPETGTTQSMTVPQAILERQASLRGQFGQVQELTLLVEELKRLRHQASVLDILGGPSSELWKEAEGIVNLATIDEEEDHRSPPGSPLSLTFSFDDSDEETLNGKRNSAGSSQPATQPYNQSIRPFARDSPKSKSVLDILQPAPRPELPRLSPSRPQKLPFDTSSLRDLVVRAGVVTRALKEVIRKVEGVDPNPEDMFPSDPPFRRIFDQPSHDDLASFDAALAEMH